MVITSSIIDVIDTAARIFLRMDFIRPVCARLLAQFLFWNNLGIAPWRWKAHQAPRRGKQEVTLLGQAAD